MKSFIYSIVFLFMMFVYSPAGIIDVPADQPTIQDGINAAANGDTVLVADDTYYENITFKGKKITVASYFLIDRDSTHIDATIIDGSQPTHPDTGSVVRFVSGEDSNSVLTGFTITGGSGTITNISGLVDKNGGGILIVFSGAKIEKNKIINNHIEAAGGLNASSAAILAGGDVGDYIVIRGNDISHNSVTTTALYGGGAVGLFTIETCLFENNRIIHNVCEASSITYGGGVWIDGSSNFDGPYRIRNNLITHNEGNSPSHRGGGMWIYQADSCYIVNNTMVNNNADLGGGIYITGSQADVYLKNSIVWGNSAPTDPGIRVYSGTITVEYSDVQGTNIWPGAGNINADPLFADTIQFCLLDTGPCIGAGMTPCPPYDMYGNPRPDPPGSMPDMGVCESPLDTPCTPGYLGDVSADNNINSTDALIILTFDAGLPIPIPQPILDRISIGFGDVNEDGTTNSTDALIILSYDAGITVPFPVGDPVCLPSSTSRSQGLTKAAANAGESIRIHAEPTSKQITREMSIDIPVIVDMTQTYEKLGSYTAELEWNPEVFEFISQSGGTAQGFENPVVNDREVDRGKLTFAHAYPYGADGEVNILNLQLEVIGEQGSDNSISLDFSAMAVAKTFVDLLPYLRTDDMAMKLEFNEVPHTYSILQYPNPFNPTTTFEFALPHSGFVSLKIYNILGEEVSTLVSEKLTAGKYNYEWDAGNLASGIYVYRIQAGDFTQTKKLILIK